MIGNLVEILAAVPFKWISKGKIENLPVSGVEFDSRQVKPGSIFFALTGKNVDGHSFIPKVILMGANAIFGSQPLDTWFDLPVPYIQVEDTRRALALTSAAFYDYPARDMTVIGVTGTDGKTTTANLLYQILRTTGLKAGMVSTVNAQIGDDILDTGFHVTTPEAPAIQYYLYKMRAAGITHVILETTSHGLAQDRVLGCEYDLGIVTNITHEHLDYHGDYQNYFNTKARLFEMLSMTEKKTSGEIRLAVLNKDDGSYEMLEQLISTPKISYSIREKTDFWAEEIVHLPERTQFVACNKAFRVFINTHLPGDFNISNCLAAFSAAVAGLGIDPKTAAKGIAEMKAVPGRMELIDLGQPFQAIVDFAHTPNAIDKALRTARQMTNGRVIAVFGSAGLRDRQKRRMMAAVSAELADITILTAEDPRTENLAEILSEMEYAATEKGSVLGQNLFLVADRGKAIEQAILMAQDSDLVIACGKGHEQSMCFGEIEYPWDDRTAMRAALAKSLGIPGPQMPYLPTREK